MMAELRWTVEKVLALFEDAGLECDLQNQLDLELRAALDAVEDQHDAGYES